MSRKKVGWACTAIGGMSGNVKEEAGMGAITQGEIRVKTALPIRSISHFTMEVRENHHGAMMLEGEIAEEEWEGALQLPLLNQEVEVEGKGELLFAGAIRNVWMGKQGRGYSVSLQGITGTCRLDTGKKNRIFQDVGCTYRQIIRKVLSGTEESFASFFSEDKVVEAPIFQIEETDWEFILRLASHMGARVTPYIGRRAGMAVGMREGGGVHTLEEGLCERIWMDEESHGMVRRLRCCENLNVGERIRFRGEELIVLQKDCRLEKGLLYFYYETMPSHAARKRKGEAMKYKNPEQDGILLQAVVLDRKEELLKVRFDIEGGQNTVETYWYPWRPETGNVMYCMPEKGETVYIRLGDSGGGKERVIYGIHKNGKGNPEMKPRNRYFTASGQKRMYLLPDEMGFQSLAGSSPLEMRISDSSGMDVISNRKVVLSAKDTIGLRAGNISFRAPKEISMVRRNPLSPTVLNMCNGFDSIGGSNEVTMRGNGSVELPFFGEQDRGADGGRTQDGAAGLQLQTMTGTSGNAETETKMAILASTPGVEMAEGLERQLEGIRVNRMMERMEYE